MITQAEYRRLKTRLTRRENAFKRARIALLECKSNTDRPQLNDALRARASELFDETAYALRIFEDDGYPDAWHRWQRDADDASYALRYTTQFGW